VEEDEEEVSSLGEDLSDPGEEDLYPSLPYYSDEEDEDDGGMGRVGAVGVDDGEDAIMAY
jgi:hypothetical protein